MLNGDATEGEVIGPPTDSWKTATYDFYLHRPAISPEAGVSKAAHNAQYDRMRARRRMLRRERREAREKRLGTGQDGDRFVSQSESSSTGV